MKQMNWLVSLLLVSSIALAACSEKEEPLVKKEASIETAPTVAVKADESVAEAARDLEGMIAQSTGKLVEEHMDPEIEAARMVDWVYYHRFYEDTFRELVKKELPAYFENNSDLSSDEIYDFLVSQLGSGQYTKYYDELVAYKHGYVMPELPEGEDEIELAKVQKTNVVILMDASGSMKAEIEGRTRMDLAKDAIEEFTSQLSDDVNVALFAYGHKGAGTKGDKELSCSSIEALYPLGEYNQTAFSDAMDSFQASGWTPLAGAMQLANDYLAEYNKDQFRNIVYIVSDGVETCDGDPIAAAKKLNDSSIEAKVNIIGFDVDDEGQNQLKLVADAGGGEYATVRNPSEFEGVLIKKWQPSVMQVISQQGVKLHELVHHLEAVTAIHDPLSNLSSRESIRIADAATFLRKEKLIGEVEAGEVIELAKEMAGVREDHFLKLKERKMAEAEQAKEDIDAKVNAWKEKWQTELEAGSK